MNKYKQSSMAVVFCCLFTYCLPNLVHAGSDTQADTQKIPTVYHGTWSTLSSYFCQKNDVNQIKISSSTIKGWQSTASVQRVSQKSNQIGLAVSVSVKDETWNDRITYELRNNQTMLIDKLHTGVEIVRYRCTK